jgi:polyphenol oxidase
MPAMPDWMCPEWPAPANVRALMTTRQGGVSRPPFDSFNLAAHVDDDPADVAENRRLLRTHLPAEPKWLTQVHGIAVADADTLTAPTEADASVARQTERVCAVLTADCLPVLFCDRSGSVVAAAHAGWRGLAAGVLEATVEAMHVPAGSILVWLGAAIGPESFGVGDEVRQAFLEQDPLAATCFRPTGHLTLDFAPTTWLADIYALARLRLARIGVGEVYGGGLCTYTDRGRFYSFRREARTGRMASLIWRA